MVVVDMGLSFGRGLSVRQSSSTEVLSSPLAAPARTPERRGYRPVPRRSGPYRYREASVLLGRGCRRGTRVTRSGRARDAVRNIWNLELPVPDTRSNRSS